MTVPLSKVPARVRRVAIRHLESLRTSPLGDRRLDGAELAPLAWPMFRPDVADVAYWEFGLVAGAAGRADEGPRPAVGGGAAGVDQIPFGFIVVSTGEHDFPIPHWSLERPPVSQALRDEAGKRGKAVGRIYRLDALAYLAEDDAGEEVARSGQVPGIVERFGEAPEGVSSMIARPKERRDDAEADKAEYEVERRGPGGEGVRVSEAHGWGRLKERYADAFGPLLADVRRNAGRAWKIDRDVEEFGEGVIAGESFSVALLERGARVDVVGEGKPDVAIERDDERRGPPRVRGRTQKRSHEKERGFELRVQYESGQSETLRYFLVSRDTRSNARQDAGGGKPE